MYRFVVFFLVDIKEQIIKLGDIARNRTAWRYVKISKRKRNIAVKLNDGYNAIVVFFHIIARDVVVVESPGRMHLAWWGRERVEMMA